MWTTSFQSTLAVVKPSTRTVSRWPRTTTLPGSPATCIKRTIHRWMHIRLSVFCPHRTLISMIYLSIIKGKDLRSALSTLKRLTQQPIFHTQTEGVLSLSIKRTFIFKVINSRQWCSWMEWALQIITGGNNSSSRCHNKRRIIIKVGSSLWTVERTPIRWDLLNNNCWLRPRKWMANRAIWMRERFKGQ